MSDVKVVTAPSVHLVGRQEVAAPGLAAFLEAHGVSWETDTEVGAEALCETAGRLCYMSFARPRPGGNAAYLGHIKEVGHGSVLEHAVWNLVFTGVSRSLTHELVRHRAGMGYSQLSQRYVDESVAEYVVPPDLALEVECARYRREVRGRPDVPLLETARRFPAADDVAYRHLKQDEFRRLADAGETWLAAVEASHAAYVGLARYLTGKWVNERDGAYGTGPGSAVPTEGRKYARQAARSVLPNATETKIFVTANARALRHFFEMRASRHADPEIRALALAAWRVLAAEAPNVFSDYREEPLPDGTSELVTSFRKV